MFYILVFNLKIFLYLFPKYIDITKLIWCNMFLKENPEIILYIKTISKICRPNSSGWYECFCPYCDDSTRKINPQTGHFHLSPTFPFAHCFRCGIKVSLEKYLLDIGFKNHIILDKLKNFPKFTYSSRTNIINYAESFNIYDMIKSKYDSFILNNYNEFKKFRKYIYTRCLDIDPIKFLLVPNISNNILQIQFLNRSGEISNVRNLFHKTRYISHSKYYFFQEISKIDSFENITICEGAFDLINLFKYHPLFKNNFFISIGGINYQNLISDIISNFLLIGNYTINVIFDQGVFNINQKIKTIEYRGSLLNPNIIFNFYIPVMSKDVSDFMLIKKLKGH